MSIDVNLNDYTREQYKHIQEKHKAYQVETQTQCTPTWYIEHVYIPLGHANKFHHDFMEKLKHE